MVNIPIINKRKGTINFRLILKNESDKSNLFFRYGYFFYPYKIEYFYYELVYLARRNIFLLFDIFFIPLLQLHDKYNSTAFLIFASLVNWSFYLIHNNLEPYKHEISSINDLEKKSMMTLMTSYIFGVLLSSNITNETRTVGNTIGSIRMIISVVFFIMITITNLGIIYFLINCWFFYFEMLKN